MKKILIIEDEFPISQVLKAYLTKQNFEVVQCYNGREAIEVFERECPHLVLLDIMLPGKNGWAILKEIRSLGSCPVIMLTALGDVNYRLEGFDEGADDYIAKPFINDEVVARVKAVLRRVSSEKASTISFGKLHIDFKGHTVKLAEKEIPLTPRDLSVLLFLAKQPNQTFTRDQLIEHVWGWDYDGSDRAVDLSIKRLRKALADWSEDEGEIRTLRGLGYQFNVHQK